MLPHSLRDVYNIAKFLEPVLSGSSLATKLLEHDAGADLKETDFLEEHNFIAKTDDGWKLTLKGWQICIVWGHVTYVRGTQREYLKTRSLLANTHLNLHW